MEPDATGSITRRSLEAQAADVLRARIITGALPQGSRLVETELAERHELSRGTIRAALRRLVDEGLVRQVPYTGYQVIELEAHDIWELATLRSSLERLAARLTAARIDEAGTAALRAAYEALETAAARDDHSRADRGDLELHSLIIRLSGNRRLARHYDRVQNQFRAYISLANRDVSSTEIAGSHRGLVERICAGDVDEAGRLAEANVAPAPEMLSSDAADRPGL